MRNVFTYGSLMFPEVWNRLVNGRYESCEAQVRGVVRKKIRNGSYPVALAGHESHRLSGRLYMNVKPADLIRLDRFEGEYYQRTPLVACIVDEDEAVTADIYMLRPRYHLLAGQEDWSPEHFEKHELKRFIRIRRFI